MIDLSQVANDPMLGDCFTIQRITGQFIIGGWQKNEPECIQAWGVVQPVSPKRLRMVPEGDRVEGSIEIVTATKMIVTTATKNAISDQVKWQDSMYRVVHVLPFGRAGFFSAVLVRMKGD